MPHPVRLITLSLLLCLASPQAQAIEFFCNPIDLCAWVPVDAQGQAVYNHEDPNLPWVIGGNEVVNLSAGNYGVGVGAIGLPMVFVIEDGTLAIEDLGDLEVGLGAWIVLCDRATFRLRDSTLRLLSDYAFQHPLFAMGQSQVEFEDARVRAMKPELEAAGYHGAFFQVMAEQSSLTVTPNTSYGFTTPHFGDAWELAVVHDAQASVDMAFMAGEFYIQGNAQVQVSNTKWHDVFFEACPGDAFTLADLPELCDLYDPVAGCITDGHQPTNFHLGPPATPFELTLTNDWVFSWAVSTYAGSSARVERAREHSNFAVGLGGIHDDLQLRLGPGSPPLMGGITDRTLELVDSHVVGWMVWPEGESHIRILPGSEVGDILPGGHAIVEVEQSLLIGAMFDSPTGTEVHLYDSVLDERATNSGGKFFATRSAISVPMAIDGPSWLADVSGVDQFDMRAGGQLHRVALTSPSTGQLIHRAGIELIGTVRAEDANGSLDPFPQAVLELDDGNQVIELATFDGPIDEDILFVWQPGDSPGGEYEFRLSFGDEDGRKAVASRVVTLEDVPVEDGGPDGYADGSDAGGQEPDAGPGDGGGDPSGDSAVDGADTVADADPADGGGGCGCGSRSPASAWSLLVILPLLAWSRRRGLSPDCDK